MPFLKFNEGAFDEAAEGAPAGAGFKYESAEVKLKELELSPRSQAVIGALKYLEISAFEISYDGGNDEGFAHPEQFFSGNSPRTFDEVAAKLAQMSLVEEYRQEAQANRVTWIAQQGHAGIARSLLDDLADELATMLLGYGFGTGEYELYGRFHADFEKGMIIDNPKAQPPSGGGLRG